MSETFKPGEFVTDGVTVFMVYEGERTRYEQHRPSWERLPPERIWLARRGEEFLNGLVTREAKALRPATCDEIFNSCVHGKLLGTAPCQVCTEKGIEQW